MQSVLIEFLLVERPPDLIERELVVRGLGTQVDDRRIGVLGIAVFSARKEVLTPTELHLVVVLGMRIRADQLLHGFHGLISAAEFVVGSRHLIENLIAVLVTGILGEQPLIESDCLDGTFGSSLSAHHPRQGSVGVAACENGAFRCCAPLKLPIGFPRAGAGNCGGLIGRVGWRGRKGLSGLRCGNFPRLEVARVYAALLPESSLSPVSPRGSAGNFAWPDRGPDLPSPPVRPGACYASLQASPALACDARHSQRRALAQARSEW